MGRAVPEIDPDKGVKVIMKGFGKTDLSDEALEALFSKIDADDSGTVSFSELTEAVRKVHGDDIDENSVMAKMMAADTNDDGEIDIDEFKFFVRTIPAKKSMMKQAKKPQELPDEVAAAGEEVASMTDSRAVLHSVCIYG